MIKKAAIRPNGLKICASKNSQTANETAPQTPVLREILFRCVLRACFATGGTNPLPAADYYRRHPLRQRQVPGGAGNHFRRLGR